MSGSLDELLRGQGVPPKHPLLDRIERNPVGANRFEDSLTVPTPGIDPLAGFINGRPVTQGQANALPLDPISGRLNPSGEIVANALMGASSGVVPKGFRAFHGSPHQVDQFSSSRIGTGEGNQAYGHGLYFAESEPVAESYLQTANWKYGGRNAETIYNQLQGQAAERGLDNAGWNKLNAQRGFWEKVVLGRAPRQIIKDALDNPDQYGPEELAYIQSLKPDRFKRKGGNMYEVEIKGDPERFIDWDKPLSGQAPEVQDAMLRVRFGNDVDLAATKASEDYMGRSISALMTDLAHPKVKGSPEAASQALREAGVPGIRYLDGGSRAGGEGTRNTVVFDDATIEILRKYGLAGLIGGGGAAVAGGASALDTFGYGQRDQLFPGEDSYFRQNPHVGGMAAEDGRIILNPYSPLKPEERAAVARNEGARLFMREREITPKFSVTDEQRASFAGTAYASDEDAMRQTLAARIISGDPSARATAEQIAEARAIFGGAMRGGRE